MKELLLALWFFVPAGVANATPIFANIVPLLNRWNTPIDFGLSWHGKRLLGDNKRIRGVVAGVLVSILVVWLQRIWFDHSAWIHTISYLNYDDVHIWMIGSLMGLGALLGDAVESFFKRQAGVMPGHSWIPFDQLDYIAGGLLLTLPFVDLSIISYTWIFIVWFGMHLIVSYIGYLLHLKDQPI
jgi:CDP-2,3-bis-(O-geranylgeranyl)-sn-glycerol synthase